MTRPTRFRTGWRTGFALFLVLLLSAAGGLMTTSTTTAAADGGVIVDPPSWRVVKLHTSWRSNKGSNPDAHVTVLATAEWEYTTIDDGVDAQTPDGDGIIDGIQFSIEGEGITEYHLTNPNDPTSCVHETFTGNPTAGDMDLAYQLGAYLAFEFGPFDHPVLHEYETCAGQTLTETVTNRPEVNYGPYDVVIPLLDPDQEAVAGTVAFRQTFDSDPFNGVDDIVTYGIVSSRCDLTGVAHADTDHDGVTDCDEVLGGSTNPADSGFLELEKDFVNAPATARVNLAITSEDGITGDTATVPNAPDGGSTGKQEVPTGTYELTETAGTNTDLASYHSALTCNLRGTSATVPVNGNTVEVGDGDDVVCRYTNTAPPATGAKTIGFWQSKNGQTIITRGTSTTGVCDSGTWLRAYAPFQDLPASATCSQVAGYTHALMKAAAARSASMNAMLKAQMLATALNVYFSDPQLGGNRVGAVSPIGGRHVDLTAVCRMLDSSTGTATCSEVYLDASPAFGGAISLAVTRMLEIASGHSNIGGSIWYGGVKHTQELAKDAFDVVNNQVAFAP